MSEHADPTDGDFLDSGVYGETDAAAESDTPRADGSNHGAAELPPYGVGVAPPGGTTGWKAAARPTAWLAVGVVAGAVVVAAWHASETTNPAANPAAAVGGLPGGQAPGGGQAPAGQLPNGQGPNGQGPNGQPPIGGPAFGGGPGFGGRAGEQRLTGTVAAVGASSVTVRLANGSTATYDVIASSDIIKNETRVSLSAIKVGDAVFLHVYPLNGRTVVEHLFAGVRPDPRGGPGSNTDDSASTTTTT